MRMKGIKMSGKRLASYLGFFVVVFIFCVSLQAGESDCKQLLDGVGKIAVPGVPGAVIPFGPNAFAVAAPARKDGVKMPVVAATKFGKGRAVAFGHEGYFKANALKVADTSQFVLNIAYWAAGLDRNSAKKPKVGVYANNDLLSFFSEQGIKATAVGLKDLDSVDVVFGKLSGATNAQTSYLKEFVKNGGGLVTGLPGWGWLMLNKNKSLATDLPCNRLFAPMGIVWTEELVPALKNEKFYLLDASLSPLTNAGECLDAALEQSRGTKKLAKKEELQAGAILTLLHQSLPPEDAIILPRLNGLLKDAATVVPSLEKTVKASDIVARLAITAKTRELAETPPDEIEAHPAAEVFPGGVPDDAPRVSRVVEVDTRAPRWHSTGLYAAPGDVITVSVPESAVGKDLQVRIGAHKDRLWHKPYWRRYPEITRVFPIQEDVTKAANAFGGAVYIVVPKNCRLGTVPITIKGAVKAPYFSLGETSLDEWREKIRKNPAPWAELASDKVVLTVHSDYVRNLDNPESLMKLWDRIMDGCADLAAIPRERKSPERYVADVQISAGALHAGYPIMGHMNANAGMVNEQDLLTKGNWGLFHEMGHNHQNRAWTFDGTTEVTVNLFSLYLQETICGIKNGDDRRVGFEPRKAKIEKFLKDGEKKPFTYLIMYVQMQEAFGWDAFKEVFAEYHSLAQNERPRTDAQERDQWLVRFSKTVGKNLTLFFEFWQVTTSEEAKNSIAHLPDWMPEELSEKH